MKQKKENLKVSIGEIRFKDLSWPLKFGMISGIFVGTIYIINFCLVMFLTITGGI